MQSAAAPPGESTAARRLTLGGVAFCLVLTILATGVAALMIDGGAVDGDPFAIEVWPLHPMWIVAVTGVGLLAALVLALRAIVKKRGRDLGAAALAVGLLPEAAIGFGILAVVVSNLPGL